MTSNQFILNDYIPYHHVTVTFYDNHLVFHIGHLVFGFVPPVELERFKIRARYKMTFEFQENCFVFWLDFKL